MTSGATMTTMDEVIVIDSDSENSVIEIEVPKKPTPPLIIIEDEEMVLNIKRKRNDSLLAKDFIREDKTLSSMPKREKSSENLNSPNHWTLDMIKYYNDDWGDEEDFVVEKLQNKMNKHPSLWVVSQKDLIKIPRNMGRNKIQCWNCGQRGHYVSDCPDPIYIPKCNMCGIEGHVEHLCPNSKCLNCGNQTRGYVTVCSKCKNHINQTCSRCELIGHNFINCPDHWRLFHMTTGTTSVNVPSGNIYKSQKDLWCCNCAKRGHYQFWCNKRKDLGGFMDTLPIVISYERDFISSQSNNTPNDAPRKKSKKSRRKENKAREKILKLNQNNKAIRKDEVDVRNKRRKKNKKNKNKKKLKKDSLINCLSSFFLKQ